MSQAEDKTLDLKTLADATENGPAIIRRAEYPTLVVMREDTYADLLDKIQISRKATGDALFSDEPTKH